MTITAIILNYKNYIDVKLCIQSLEAQLLPPGCTLKILIIDNASGDGGTEKIQTEFPQHRYVYNSTNLGFAKGVNQGINECSAESDYFLLVNNDAELHPDCCSRLIEASQTRAIAGPAIYYKEEPEIIWQGGGYFSRLKMNISVPDKNQRLKGQENLVVDFLSGCVMLIPKSAIEHLKGFDESFFFYGEDLDFCLRAKAQGLPVIYVQGARAWHNIKRAAISRTNPFVLDNLAFSFVLIARKHFPSLLPYTVLLFCFLYTPFRLYQTIKGGNPPRNILAWLRGGWRGLTIKL